MTHSAVYSNFLTTLDGELKYLSEGSISWRQHVVKIALDTARQYDSITVFLNIERCCNAVKRNNLEMNDERLIYVAKYLYNTAQQAKVDGN
ncbi:hypothetical protein [Sporolactobacillus pectinivorans]|uniref:hypothetical protein n=1 Tax=Sporolactobacillus pectinivorans TaxID=1591408 RepID=UPI000C25A2C7|nr:hypothetical protein [Sporolactobacillus pectinivorans]